MPETGPRFFRKLRKQVTSTAVFIHVVLLPPMARKMHICKVTAPNVRQNASVK